MNIFVLDYNPERAAEYHCDKHVIKMILESAQMLCTAINEIVGIQITLYKSTHKNHSCSLWVRSSKQNAEWLKNLNYHLNKEYKLRYNKKINHKSWNVIKSLN